MTELAVVSVGTQGLTARGLVDAALGAAAEALRRADTSPAIVVGVASMAETGALTDAAGAPRGPLVRWDRVAGQRRPDGLGARLDPRALHLATGVPLTPKLPLLA